MLYLLSKIIKKSRLASIKKSKLDKTSKIESGTTFLNSKMGRNSYCGYDCTIINTEIGSFCSIASNVKIGGVAHPLEFISTSPVFLSHKDSIKAKYASHEYLPILITKIGHDVWIGDGAFIKAGISIGVGSVIGMGSVVTKDVAPYSVVAGNPARVIRKRFTNEIIQSLLASEWWNRSDVELQRLGKYANDPHKFIDEAFK